jgi:hypothetical protein
MDIEYAVKQLDLEIRQGEQRVTEKRQQRDQLYSALSAEQKARVDEAGKPPKPKKPHTT